MSQIGWEPDLRYKTAEYKRLVGDTQDEHARQESALSHSTLTSYVMLCDVLSWQELCLGETSALTPTPPTTTTTPRLPKELTSWSPRC